MNIQRVNNWIIYGREALVALDIAEKGQIIKTFRGQISSFGAAVSMGNLKSAIAFFSEQAGASVAREKLICAIWFVLQRAKGVKQENIDVKNIKTDNIFDYVCRNDSLKLKNDFLDASLAIKLAMNLFDLVKEIK